MWNNIWSVWFYSLSLRRDVMHMYVLCIAASCGSTSLCCPSVNALVPFLCCKKKKFSMSKLFLLDCTEVYEADTPSVWILINTDWLQLDAFSTSVNSDNDLWGYISPQACEVWASRLCLCVLVDFTRRCCHLNVVQVSSSFCFRSLNHDFYLLSWAAARELW